MVSATSRGCWGRMMRFSVGTLSLGGDLSSSSFVLYCFCDDLVDFIMSNWKTCFDVDFASSRLALFFLFIAPSSLFLDSQIDLT